MDDFKITKTKYYRINFRYKGKHYSISEREDDYEEYVLLTCKEDKDFQVVLKYGDFHYLDYMPKTKQGRTYRDSDLSKIHAIIDKYIERGRIDE